MSDTPRISKRKTNWPLKQHRSALNWSDFLPSPFSQCSPEYRLCLVAAYVARLDETVASRQRYNCGHLHENGNIFGIINQTIGII